MDTVFRVMFTVVVIANIGVVAVLCRQVWRQVRHRAPGSLVVNGTDVLYAAAAFSGPMILTGLLVRGWDGVVGLDPIVYGSAVGVVCAALLTWARRAGVETPALWMALVLPMGFGVLAGLSGA